MNKQGTIFIPEISDEELVKRMNQIKWVVFKMRGVNNKPYTTDEVDGSFLSLYYRQSNTDPRTQSFNFDENAVIGELATDLNEIRRIRIFVKIGGYHGFCKITMAEVMSQIPSDILHKVVAFSLTQEEDTKILNGDYQETSIVLYEREEQETTIVLPSYLDLVKPIDLDRANILSKRIKPALKIRLLGDKTELQYVDPMPLSEAFISINIWMRVNGSNLHKHNSLSLIEEDVDSSHEIKVYQTFDNNSLYADPYMPNYAYLISQISDELITDRTIGILYRKTDFFKVKEGVIHESIYQLIERK